MTLPAPFESLPWWLPPLLIWIAVASLVAFIAHGRDKRAARRSARRTPEARLHLHELVGGWPGALIAMSVFRHKTRKPSYLVITAAIIAAWIAVGVWLAM